MEQVAISPHYRGKDRKRRLLANGIPPGPYRVLASSEPAMIGRVWSKDMICYGIVDGHLEIGMLFWLVAKKVVLCVGGRQVYSQERSLGEGCGNVLRHDGEWLEVVGLHELTDVQRRRIYCWRRSCRKGKMRDNQS